MPRSAELLSQLKPRGPSADDEVIERASVHLNLRIGNRSPGC
jgi:hypothetical protein